MRVVVCGSREFDNYMFLEQKLDHVLTNCELVTILSGTARGADSLGEHYAYNRGCDVERWPADWKRYGKAAGHIRNEAMADSADLVVAFWDGRSPGTKHMIDYCRNMGIDCFIFQEIKGL